MDTTVLGVCPETLNAIDMRAAASKLIASIINSQMIAIAYIQSTRVGSPAV